MKIVKKIDYEILEIRHLLWYMKKNISCECNGDERKIHLIKFEKEPNK